MQSNTESGRKCDHAVNGWELTRFEFSGKYHDKKVTCAKSVEAVLLLRRDLKTYFMEKREKVVFNFEDVLILGLGKSLYKRWKKVISSVKSEKEIELDSVRTFLESLSSAAFYRYTEAYFDFINQSLDEYIDKLRDDFKESSTYTKFEIDSFFKSYNIPEDFCYRVSKPWFLIDLGKDIENICNNRNTGFVNCSEQGGGEQDVKAKYFYRSDVEGMERFCKREGWEFSEFFELIANLFFSLDVGITWRFFSSKLNQKDSMEDCIDFKYLFSVKNKDYRDYVVTFDRYLGELLRKKGSEVNSFSQKGSLTISRSFAAAPPKRGVDTNIILEDSEVTRASLSSISQSFAAAPPKRGVDTNTIFGDSEVTRTSLSSISQSFAAAPPKRGVDTNTIFGDSEVTRTSLSSISQKKYESSVLHEEFLKDLESNKAVSSSSCLPESEDLSDMVQPSGQIQLREEGLYKSQDPEICSSGENKRNLTWKKRILEQYSTNMAESKKQRFEECKPVDRCTFNANPNHCINKVSGNQVMFSSDCANLLMRK